MGYHTGNGSEEEGCPVAQSKLDQIYLDGEMKHVLVDAIRTDSKWTIERIVNGQLNESDVQAYEANAANLRKYFERRK